VGIPAKFGSIRKAALKAIQPVGPADVNCYFYGERTRAGQNLPPYHLVYFLLVELLGFQSLGQGEKVAWSVPIAFGDKIYVIEHRKLGLGVFAQGAKAEEEQAAKIVALIRKAVSKATPFFEWLAEQAVANSKLNVANRSASLLARFEYLRDLYKKTADEAESRKDERIVEETRRNGGLSQKIHFPAFELRRNAEWLGLSAIDAFFSWTEHVFIHLAILQSKITTGVQVADLATGDWSEKFKQAIGLNDKTMKRLFDDLLIIRRQTRNYMAHGAFGKRGEAFRFHSSAGAVPVLLPHQAGKRRFTLLPAADFNEPSAFDVIEEFISHLWSRALEPARTYIQESHLPVILPLAKDGRYEAAMQSVDDMQALITKLQYDFDRAADMDW
jgi:hypothetical protein